VLVAFEVQLGGPGVDLVSSFHEEDRLVDQVVGDARLDSDVLCVQVHMASLDPFNAQGSEGSKVLCKAN